MRVAGDSSSAADPGPTRVLVVDDEAIVRDVIVTMLVRAGYDARGADSAESARELLADPALALVLSDVRMPGLSGLDLLGTFAGRGVPVLLMTGDGGAEVVAEALGRGAAGVLAKPFGSAELLAAVRAALARGES